MVEAPPVFVKWYEFLEWLLGVTTTFPKKIRFTLTTRIDNTALQILEDIIECRYDRNARVTGLKKMNIKFEKLRVFLRMCNRLKYLSNVQYEYAMVHLNEVGRMAGGWLKKG